MTLVSAILVTYNRRAWIPQAVECFLRQTYPWKELIVVDDGTDPIEDLLPLGVEYVRPRSRMTIGAKRNLACSRANGNVIVHWDDDDWSAPGRMTDQVERLQASAAELTGYHSMIFEDLDSGKRWKYRGAACYALGTSLCYTREFWRSHPFPDVNVGEDNAVVYRARPVSVDAGELMVARIHGNNTNSTRSTLSAECWKELVA